jgi:hypothetical protein
MSIIEWFKNLGKAKSPTLSDEANASELLLRLDEIGIAEAEAQLVAARALLDERHENAHSDAVAIVERMRQGIEAEQAGKASDQAQGAADIEQRNQALAAELAELAAAFQAASDLAKQGRDVDIAGIASALSAALARHDREISAAQRVIAHANRVAENF